MADRFGPSAAFPFRVQFDFMQPMGGKLDIQLKLEDRSENQVRFEWMLQSGQVDDRALAEALALEAYPGLLQMAMTLLDGPGLAKPIVLQTIREAVDQRHRYTGEETLKVWLFCLAYQRIQRGAGFRLFQGLQTNLLLFLRYAQDLSIIEIGHVLGLKAKKAAGLLDGARRKKFEAWGQPLGWPDLPLGHARFASLIQAALDGCLDPQQAVLLEAHLGECPACKRHAGQLAAQEDRLRQAARMAWPQQKLSEDEQKEIRQALEDQVSQTGTRRRLSISAKELSLGLAVVAVIALLAWFGGMLKPEKGRPASARTRVVVYVKITATPGNRVLATPSQTQTPTATPDIKTSDGGVADNPNSFLIDFRKFSASSLGYTGPQVWSSSGPVALASVLKYWGWEGSPNTVVEALKPNPRDEVVMPDELINFGEMRFLSVRYCMGGNIQLLRQLTQHGFPVIVERGTTLPENRGWAGRYQVVLGYDNQKGLLAVQVNFPEEGSSLVRFDAFERDWRAFNYAFLVAYPEEKDSLLMKLLGDYERAGEESGAHIAAKKASDDIFTTDGVDRFFAWFNRGTSLAELDDSHGAAEAFDEAFALYKELPEDQRPWRILWYQTRPYWAYYYTARYRDLIDLATSTLKSSEGSVLEESYYWRALAREALGDKQGAIADLQEAVRLNPYFDAGGEQLQRLTNGTYGWVADNPDSLLMDFDFYASSLGYAGSQVWSSSGPVALASVLKYWGWEGSPDTVVEALKPNPQDENVMPYELIKFVEARSQYKVLYRMGGDVQLLRELTRQRFPVIVERGVVLPKNQGWAGCYQIVLGYESGQGIVDVRVNFLGGYNEEWVDAFERDWRAFNYAFLVVYPVEKQDLLMKLLGEYADEDGSARTAAQRASDEIFTTNGVDNFFAWFNRGTSLAELDDYGGAARAYDEAFSQYKDLPENQRPWRILWYQTRPYWAYYYTARYRDLIDLATSTLNASEGSALEESYYWRALAREALGDKQGAIADLQEAVRLNPHFDVGLEQLQRLTKGT